MVWTVCGQQPPPQALRFSHSRGERETSDWWWTARDHEKGTDGRRVVAVVSVIVVVAVVCVVSVVSVVAVVAVVSVVVVVSVDR